MKSIKFFFAAVILLSFSNCIAQSPGGVSGAAVWLRADVGVTPGTTVGAGNPFTWNDQSGHGLNVNSVQSAGAPYVNTTAPAYNNSTTGLMNFNPTITFGVSVPGSGGASDGNQFLSFAAGQTNPNFLNTTAFVAGIPTVTGNGGTLWGDSTNFHWFFDIYGTIGNYLGSDVGASTFTWNSNEPSMASINYTSGSTATATFSKLGVTGSPVSAYNGSTAFGYYSVGGNTGVNGTGNLYNSSFGKMAETIIFSPALTDPTQITQVNSYLAFKYGLTLNNGGTTYLSSTSSISMWTSNATFTHNIFGIGTDNISGLMQQVSTADTLVDATNTGLLTISTSSDFVSNNPGRSAGAALSNLTFVTIGDDGGSVTNWAGTKPPPGKSTLGRNWKLQSTTATTPTIYLQFNSTNIIAGSLPVTSISYSLVYTTNTTADYTSNTTTLPLTKTGNLLTTGGISLPAGAIFTIIGSPMISYSPGGVNAAVWLRADAGVTPGTTVGAGNPFTWNDQSGHGLNVNSVQSAGMPYVNTTAPAYNNGNTNLMNFNPTITFGASVPGSGGATSGSQFLSFPAGQTDPNFLNTTAFVAGIPTVTSNGGTVWGDSTNFYWLLDIYGTIGDYFGTAQGSSSYTWASNEPSMASVNYISGSTATATFSKLGVTGSSVSTTGYNGPYDSRYYSIGGNTGVNGGNDLDNSSFGKMAETIIFSPVLTDPTQITQVNSYLALKYGLTLNNGGTTYLASTSSLPMWTSNATFTHNIFGIGTDSISGLKQQVSTADTLVDATNTGLLTISTSADFVSNNPGRSAGTALPNLTFVTIGDDGGSVTTWAGTKPPPGKNTLGRNWKVQSTTATTPTIYLQFDSANIIAGGLPNTATTDSLVYTTNATADYTSNTTKIPLTRTGNLLTTGGITLPAGAIFTITGISIPLPPAKPGGITPIVWLKADLGVTGGTPFTWTDQSGNGLNVSSSSAAPAYSNVSNLINFNPIVSFQNAGNKYLSFASASAGPLVTGSTVFVAGAPYGPGSSNGENVAWSDPSYTYFLFQEYNNKLGNYINDGSDVYSSFPWATNEFSIVSQSVSTVSGSGSSSKDTMNFSKLGAGPQQVISSSVASLNGERYYSLGGASGTSINFSFGTIAETIIYPQILNTAAALQPVYSYLATKYGYTLPENYISPNASIGTYFNLATNVGYNSDITVIGHESAQGLDQEQSFSQTSTFPIYIGANNAIATSNAAHGSSLTDSSYEAFGNNGLSATISTINTTGQSTTNAGGLRMARVWKVQETGTVSAVMIAVPLSAFSASPCNSFLVVNSSDPTFASGNTLISSTGTQTVNGIVCTTFNVDFITGQYFTFSQNITAPPGTVPNGNSVSAVPVATCSDASSYNAFVDNAATPTKKYLAINANGNNLSAVTVTVSDNNGHNPKTDGVNNTTAVSSNMYTIDDGSNGLATYLPAMTVRVYFNPGDTVAARAALDPAVTSPPTSKWFKYEGSATSAMAAQTPTGITGATYLIPTYGTEGGVNYAEFSGITNFSTFGFIAFNSLTALAINLENFKGTRQGSNNMLQWTVGDAVNFRQFQLQRSGTSSGSFTTIATIVYTNGQSNYSYIDPNISANGYYRLALVNDDGTLSYSNVVYIAAGSAAQSIKVSPNPTASGSMVTITLTGYTGRATGRLYDGAGKVVSIISRLTNGNNTLSTATLAKGVYYVIVTDTNGNTCTEKIVVR